jgi:hypothetical protein
VNMRRRLGLGAGVEALHVELLQESAHRGSGLAAPAKLAICPFPTVDKLAISRVTTSSFALLPALAAASFSWSRKPGGKR